VALTRDVAGRRYALAIVELARERDDFDSWLEAVEALEALTAEPASVAALQGDGMTDERFQTIVRQVAPGIGETQMNLFRLLRHKSRLALGASVASYFRELRDEESGVERALVSTAVELDEERRGRLERQLTESTHKSVEVEMEVDPALLGGAVIRIGDRLIDGSTRGRLRRLRDRLAASAAGGPQA